MTVTEEEIETAFSSAEPIPVAELERGVGPMYWYGLGYRRAAGVYGAGHGEASPAALGQLEPDPWANLEQWLFADRDNELRIYRGSGRWNVYLCNDNCGPFLEGATLLQALREAAKEAARQTECGGYAGNPAAQPEPSAEALQPNDMGVIRAAEGVVLEPGEYDSIDPTGASRFKTRKRILVYRSNSGVWAWNVSALSFPMVTAVRRVEPGQGERPIVVDSIWIRNTDEVEFRVDAVSGGVVDVTNLRNGFRGHRTVEHLRDGFTWLRDPAPKAEPSAPEAEGCRKHHLIHCSACQEERYLRSVERERDAALSRITEIEARQLNTDAGMNTLRKQHEELEAENARLRARCAFGENELCKVHQNWDELKAYLESPSPVDGGS